MAIIPESPPPPPDPASAGEGPIQYTPTGGAFDQLFDVIKACRIAICKECFYGVLPLSISTHVNTQHREQLPVDTRKEIGKTAVELAEQGVLAKDIKGIRYPERTTRGIPGLPFWRDGKKCIMEVEPDGKVCGEVMRNRGHIQVHCKTKHGWVNIMQVGRSAAGGKDKVWVDGVLCQQMGRTAGLQRLFEIAEPAHWTEISVTRSKYAGKAHPAPGSSVASNKEATSMDIVAAAEAPAVRIRKPERKSSKGSEQMAATNRKKRKIDVRYTATKRRAV
jgi:hypothetical protein